MLTNLIKDKRVLLAGPGKSLDNLDAVINSGKIDCAITMNDVISIFQPDVYFVSEKYYFKFAAGNYRERLKKSTTVFMGFEKKNHEYRITKSYFEENKSVPGKSYYIEGITSDREFSYPYHYVDNMDGKSKKIVSYLHKYFPAKKDTYIRCGNLGNVLQILLNYCPKSVYLLGFMDSISMDRHAKLAGKHKNILPNPKHAPNLQKTQISFALQKQLLCTLSFYYAQRNVTLITLCHPSENQAVDVCCQTVEQFLDGD